MKKTLLITLTFIMASCSTHTKRVVASDSRSEIVYNVKELAVVNRAHHVEVEITPPTDEILKLDAVIVFGNGSEFKVQLVQSITDSIYSLKTVIPFTFNPETTKIRVFDENGKFYNLPL